MRKRSVIRDTIQMTVIQFFLECLALWFNCLLYTSDAADEL